MLAEGARSSHMVNKVEVTGAHLSKASYELLELVTCLVEIWLADRRTISAVF